MKLTHTLLLLLTIGLITAAALAHRRSLSATATTVQNPKTAVQAELITITSTGFEPAELTRPNGRFLLAIDNRSGLDEVDLYLERETGGRVNVSLSRKGKLAWREILDLQPGAYLLRARNEESWRCRITITR